MTLVATIVVISCTQKKTNTIIITKKNKQISAVPKTRKMGDYTQTRTVEWVGNKYIIETQLMADPSLPLAHDGEICYYDNRIVLKIVRADSSIFFEKTFTKSFFKEYVDNMYFNDGALLGVVFVQAKGNHLIFAASVGNPDKSSDEYVPLILKIDNLGNVTVTKDNLLDTKAKNLEEEDIDGV